MKLPNLSDNPNKVQFVNCDGKWYPEVQMPEIYMVVGPYAVWMTSPIATAEHHLSEMFLSAPIVKETASLTARFETFYVDYPNAIDLDDIENWEGTSWYSPEDEQYEPTENEMSELKETIRTFTLNALMWTINN